MWAAVDFETTGLLLHPQAQAPQPRAVEFAAVREDGEERVWLFDPGVPLPPEIIKITGITPGILDGAPPFQELWPEIDIFMPEEVWAHNAAFDSGILHAELARFGGNDAHRWRCTVEEYAPEWGYRPRLIHLYEWMFGEPLAQEHRALSDTRALAKIVRTMKESC